MTTYTDAVIVGGGQAGLAVSYYLRIEARDHVVLEQAEKPAEVWRNHRWDSFTLNTPNWQSRLPGADHPGADPDGFVSREGVVDYFETYAKRFRLPIRYCKRVSSVERDPRNGMFIVTIEGGERIQTCNVVIATGLYQTPKVPAFAADLPAGVRQVHSDAYRNPQELRPGAVLVVGSAQSGAQIAEELCAAGRKVYLAVGRAGRTPRRYRGKDANWWHDKLGDYDKTVSELPSPKAKFAGKPIISGTRGGHTLNLHQFARDGVTLVGHRNFLNSSFNQTATSLAREGRPSALMHPDDMGRLGLNEGDVVRLGNARGEIGVHVKSSPGATRGVIVSEGLWDNRDFLDGRGVNTLTGADSVAPFGGAAFHDVRVWARANAAAAADGGDVGDG